MRTSIRAGLLLGGLAPALGCIQADRFVEVGSVHATESAAGVEQLALHTSVGDVEFVAGLEEDYEIEALVRVKESRLLEVTEAILERDLSIRREGSLLVIEDGHLGDPDHNDWSVALTVRGPSCERIEATCAVGGVRVDGEFAAARTVTGVGTVRVEGSARSLEVESGVGEVFVDADVLSLEGSVGTGSAEVRTRDLDTARLTTGVGNVRLEVTGSGPHAGLVMRAGTGDVSIRVRDFDGAVSLDAGVGDVRVRGVEGLDVGQHFVHGYARGSVGDGAGRIEASTGVGSISLRRE